jgi:aryl-alcohol dehydrogenase
MSVEITAAVCRTKSVPFTIETLELDEPRADEVLVRVVASGVCHTDLICRDQWYDVPLPAVFGHEGAGVVERVGSNVSKVKPGDHVVMSFVSCGHCPTCRAGRVAYCAELYARNFSGARPDGTSALHNGGTPIHGHFFGQSSWATYSVAYERNVVKVDPAAPLELLGPLGCGVQTGAGAVLNTLHPHAGTSLAVFGAGAVGLSAVMGARVAGCTTIVAVDIKANRLALAQELGATHVFDASNVDVVAAIKDATRGGADFSLETTASPKVFRAAVDCLGPLGTCGLIGAAALGTEATFDMNDILLPGKTIKGVIEGDSVPDVFIPRLVELIRQDRFPLARLVKSYGLAEVNEAADASLSGATIKPILVMA